MDTFLIFLTIFAIVCGVVAIWLFFKNYILILIHKKIVEMNKHRKAEKYMDGEMVNVMQGYFKERKKHRKEEENKANE